MEIRVLKYFLAVAREGTITGAASKLHVTQPTLSKQLMDLEEELGTTLFVRGKRKISLTEEGIFFQKRAEEIVELADKTKDDLKGGNENVAGEVLIGGGETEAMRIIAQTAKKLQKSYPEIKYYLYSGNAEDLKHKIDNGLLDFGLFIEPVKFDDYDYVALNGKDTWGVLMRKDSKLAKYKTIKSDQLKDVPIICSRQERVHNQISGWLGFDFGKLDLVATYNLIYNAALMAEEGVGYVLCLDKLANVSPDSPLTFRPLEPPLEAGVVVAWKKHKVFSPAAEKFLETLQEIN